MALFLTHLRLHCRSTGKPKQLIKEVSNALHACRERHAALLRSKALKLSFSRLFPSRELCSKVHQGLQLLMEMLRATWSCHEKARRRWSTKPCSKSVACVGMPAAISAATITCRGKCTGAQSNCAVAFLFLVKLYLARWRWLQRLQARLQLVPIAAMPAAGVGAKPPLDICHITYHADMSKLFALLLQR